MNVNKTNKNKSLFFVFLYVSYLEEKLFEVQSQVLEVQTERESLLPQFEELQSQLNKLKVWRIHKKDMTYWLAISGIMCILLS